LSSRVIAKLTSYTLKLFLRRFWGIEVQTFTQVATQSSSH